MGKIWRFDGKISVFTFLVSQIYFRLSIYFKTFELAKETFDHIFLPIIIPIH